MRYFKDIKTVEQLKKTYRRLARKFHPDMGGTTEDMQEINKEYEQLFKTVKNSKDNIDDGYREVINAIIHLNINIEVCGTWIWVSGKTYPVRAEIKKAGYTWASKKKKWFWRPETAKSTGNRKGMKMEHIRKKYGSKQIKEQSYTQVADESLSNKTTITYPGHRLSI